MENNTKSNLGGDYETIIPKLNASERAILDSVLADVKQGKMKISVQTEYKIMYMFYLIKTHPSILEKLGYSRERDFGSFAHRFFGFEKSKASKYWRVGKLFIDYDNEHNEYFCKIAPVDMFGNRVELKPTFLLEMLFSSKYEKYLDITQFWYDCFTYGIFDKMVGGLCQANIRKINNYVRNHLETATTVQNFKILMLSNNSPFADKNNELKGVNKMIAIGCDHAAVNLKKAIMAHLDEKQIPYIDLGTDGTSCDYPNIAKAVCEKILSGEAEKGILLCGTGIGMSIAANKFKGIRAAVCSDCFSARYTRLHNNANVLCMGERVIGQGLALELIDIFLETGYEGGRHQRRLDLITDIENKE